MQKAWDDQNNKYNLRPSRVKINLYRWTNKNSTKTLVGSAYITKNDNWKVTWNNLLRNDGTTTYNYTAEEEAVPGYTGKMVWKGSYEAGRVGTLTNTLQSSAVKLLKTSSMPDVTNGNDCYSLKGAEYGVYSDSSLSGASKVGVLTTDENGESNTLTLNAGTYYVRETTAPKGYALDKTAYTITIKPNETYTLKVSDKPTLDPVGVLLGKVDKETNQNKPEGSLSLEGALFTAKFYAGVQSDSDPAADGKTADRTWVFRTNEDGFCYYEEKYLESGDELYLSPTKNPSLPIGTLTIQETQAPEGYLINSEVYVVKITSSNDGSDFVYTYNEPEIPEQSLDLNIVKKEKGKDYVIEGAVFEHTKPDGTTETVTNPEAQIKIKSDYPSVTKKIQEDDANANITDVNRWNDIGDYEIGQTVPYKYTSNVPDINGYDTYYYAWHDIMSDALTFNKNSVKIEISGTVDEKEKTYTLSNTEFAVTENPGNGDSFMIAISDLKAIVDREFDEIDNRKENTYGQTVTVTYNATLNDKAAENTGRPGFENDVRLEFSNDADSAGEGKTGYTRETVQYTVKSRNLKARLKRLFRKTGMSDPRLKKD